MECLLTGLFYLLNVTESEDLQTPKSTLYTTKSAAM